MESLLAAALFSFGLLGAGALITERLREAREAHAYFLADMLAQDLAARIQADPRAAGGGEFQDWLRQASGRLPGLQCSVTPLGGAPPAYRLELSWPAAGGDSARLAIRLGQ